MDFLAVDNVEADLSQTCDVKMLKNEKKDASEIFSFLVRMISYYIFGFKASLGKWERAHTSEVFLNVKYVVWELSRVN